MLCVTMHILIMLLDVHATMVRILLNFHKYLPCLLKSTWMQLIFCQINKKNYKYKYNKRETYWLRRYHFFILKYKTIRWIIGQFLHEIFIIFQFGVQFFIAIKLNRCPLDKYGEKSIKFSIFMEIMSARNEKGSTLCQRDLWTCI